MHSDFYNSREWEQFRKVVILERLHDDGLTYCEYCHKPILKAYDCITHHKVALTDFNVHDVNISLNPDNIMLVHHRCHNRIHNKLGNKSRNVYIVYGSPCSGKSTYVRDNILDGDLVVDIDKIWQCISGMEMYVKPNQLKDNVFAVRNLLIDNIKLRVGNWNNAYVVGGYPLIGERERLTSQLGARLIHIDTAKDVCISRLENNPQGRDIGEWRKYIDDWWEKYQR